MNNNLIKIRTASEDDAKELLRIYTPYVTDTAITFEYEVPSVDEFADRIKNTLIRYPYLVAIKDSQIIGYAYASEFKDRAAYDWAVETTIYLDQNHRGQGVGKKLYTALERVLKKQNILNMNACIAYAPDSDAVTDNDADDDVHLSNASSEFHQHMGYRKVAHFTKCGYKFGTWYDMIWMEKILGEHTAAPESFIPFSRLWFP